MKGIVLGRLVAVAFTIACLSTCGGGSPSTPTPGASTPAQQVRTVIGNADFTLRAGSATFKAIDNPPIGMMDVTVEWGSASNPITQANVAVRSIDTGGFNYRDPTQDGDGNWVVHPGEFVVFDFSQRNGAGEKCKWINPPEWDVTDDDEIVEVKGSSQPFLLR